MNLFFDLETVPDYDRVPQELIPKRDEAPCSPEELVSGTIASTKEVLGKSKAYPDEWYTVCVEKERTGRERQGLIDVLIAARKSASRHMESSRKKLSITPEYCRICAWCYTFNGHTNSGLCHNHKEEKDALELFWRLAHDCIHIVGFNILHFDLPVIFVRSAILGITPTRTISLGRYSNKDCRDLAVARFGGGVPEFDMKTMAKLWNVEIPCEGVDGSMTEELYGNNPDKLVEYVESDVEVCVGLHDKMEGLFFGREA